MNIRALLVAVCFLALPLSSPAQPVPPFPDAPPVPLTPEQRVEIQDCLRWAVNLRAWYESQKQVEGAFRLGRTTPDTRRLSQAWHTLAAETLGREEQSLMACLDLLEEYHGLDRPVISGRVPNPARGHPVLIPGTSTKGAQMGFLSTPAFLRGPGAGASLLVHELTHVHQIEDCWSTHPGFWDEQSAWGNAADAEAYRQELLAHAAGATSLDRMEWEFLSAMMRTHRAASRVKTQFPWVMAEFEENLVHLEPGEEATLKLVLTNISSAPREVTIVITDGMGWEITPREFRLVEVPANPVLIREIVIRAPTIREKPTEELFGAYNSLSARVLSDDEGPDDPPLIAHAFAVVRPPFSLSLAPQAADPRSGGISDQAGAVIGARGSTVDIPILVTNASSDAGHILIDISDPKAWPVEAPSSAITVPAGSTVEVPNLRITIPMDGVPAWSTNAVRVVARRASDGAPSAPLFVPIHVDEFDLGLLGPVAPVGRITAGQSVTPAVVVADNSGPLAPESHFDVTYQIIGPAGPDPQIVAEGRETFYTGDMFLHNPPMGGGSSGGSSKLSPAGAAVPKPHYTTFPPRRSLVASWTDFNTHDPGLYVVVYGIEPDEIDKEGDSHLWPDADPENNTLVLEFEVVPIADGWAIQ